MKNRNAFSSKDRLLGPSRIFTALVVVLVLLGFSPGRSSAQATQVNIWSIPALFPEFNPSVTDYVVRCQQAKSVHLFGFARSNTTVSIDNGEPQTGGFSQSVSLSNGQRFQITVATAGQTTVHYVRCLPSDFPHFSATRTGATQAEWYALTLNAIYGPSWISQQYLAIIDNNGVPVWWEKTGRDNIPSNATMLSNGDLLWLHGVGYKNGVAEEQRLDGTLVQAVSTVGSKVDQHDAQLLPNGDFVMGWTFARSGVDMSACGGAKSGTLMDFELQVLSPSGDLVWSWRASDHIPLSEVATQWRWKCILGGDVYHWNSVEQVGTDFVISFRHLDAVYRINGTSGDIEWKLGGTPTPESLTVVGDPLSNQGPLDSQHDARVLPDGSLTVFDNGTSFDRPPEDVRFAIDETARTATLLQSVTNPEVPRTNCCGSTRRLPGGDWVTSWGDRGYVTEQTSTGQQVFRLVLASTIFAYRANPVLPGQLSPSALRAGMDAQYPRGNP